MHETSPKIRKYQEDYINLIRRVGNREGVSRRFYIIMEFVQTDTNMANDEYDIIDCLHRAKQTVRKQLYACGNDIIFHENEEKFVLETIYSIINKSQKPQNLWNKMQETAQDVLEYYNNDEEKLEELDKYYNNMCAPEKIDIYRDYCVIDDTYYTFLYIPSKSFPELVKGAWLTGLINYQEGVDIDIFIEKKDTKSTKNKIRQRMRINTARANHSNNPEGENFEELVRSIQSSDFIKNRLSNGEEFFYVNILISISGSSFDEIYQKSLNLKDLLTSTDIEPHEPTYRIEHCLKSYMPTYWIDKTIYEKSKRNITTSGLGSFYPFSSLEVSDDDGLLLGVSNENNSMVVLDSFNRDKYSNGNTCIFGTSGAGKSFTLQSTCMRYRLKNVQTFIIVPEKGDEYERSCDALDGQFVTIARGSKDIINIMEIRPVEDENMTKIGFSSRRTKQSILDNKIQSITTFFKLIIPDLDMEEMQLIDAAIIETYAQKGITKDNSSLLHHYEERMRNGKKCTVPVYKEMPILEDLYKIIEQQPDLKRVTRILHTYVYGSVSTFNGQTNVDLSNKYIVFDLTYLDDDLKPIGMFLALDFIWDKCREDKTQKKVIAIDEAWMLISKVKQAAEFMQKIFKLIRGYGGIAIAATQDINDFFTLEDGVYSKAILNNSEIKMLLKLKPDEAENMQEVFKLSDEEKNNICRFDTGQILVKSNSNTFSVSYIASDFEKYLISSDINTLNSILNKQFVV